MLTASIDTDKLWRAMGILMRGKTTAKDIISKCLMVKPDRETGTLDFCCRHGVSYLRVKIPAQFSGDTRYVIFDARSVHLAASVGAEKIQFVYDDSKGAIIEMLGKGFMYAETYNLDTHVFEQEGLSKPSSKWEVDRAEYYDLLTRLKPVVEASHTIPDLKYYFLNETGGFGSNGMLIAKYVGVFPEITIREKDAVLLRLVLDKSKGHEGNITLEKFHNCWALKTPEIEYAFPMVSHDLSDEWKLGPAAIEDYHEIPYMDFKKCAEVVRATPDTTGRIIVSVVERVVLRGRTQKGDESEFILNSNVVGRPQVTSYSMDCKAIQTALSVLAGSETVRVGTSRKGLFQIYTDKIQEAIMGRTD